MSEDYTRVIIITKLFVIGTLILSFGRKGGSGGPPLLHAGSSSRTEFLAFSKANSPTNCM
jgi:hypothetical protein